MTALRLPSFCVECAVRHPARLSPDGKQSSIHRQSFARSLHVASGAACPASACMSVNTNPPPVFDRRTRSSPTHPRAERRIASPAHRAQTLASNAALTRPSPNTHLTSFAQNQSATSQTPGDERSARDGRVQRVSLVTLGRLSGSAPSHGTAGQACSSRQFSECPGPRERSAFLGGVKFSSI